MIHKITGIARFHSDGHVVAIVAVVAMLPTRQVQHSAVEITHLLRSSSSHGTDSPLSLTWALTSHPFF